MAGQINISGSTEAVQLHGNDDYTVARDFTFPDESGELLIKTANGNVPGVGAINGGPIGGFRNAIINGDFRVFQRGTSFSVGSSVTAFTADRMLIFSDAGTSITATRSDPLEPFDHSIRIAKGAGQTGRIGQLIELNRQGHNSQFKLNSTWTVSIYSTADLSGTSPNVSFRDKSFPNPAASPACTATAFTQVEPNRYAAQVTIDVNTATALNTAKGLLVLIPLNTGATVNYSGFQFEPGPVATVFEHRPIGTELALCQRYFQVGSALTMFSDNPAGPANRQATYVLPTTLRVSPDAGDVTWSRASGSGSITLRTPQANSLRWFTTNAGNEAVVINFTSVDAEL